MPRTPRRQRAKPGLEAAAKALPSALLELGVVFFHLRLALLDRCVEQEYERRQRESPYDVGRRVPELRRGDKNKTAKAEQSGT